MSNSNNNYKKPDNKTYTVAKWLLITLVGVALYLWRAEAAYTRRGYEGYGGEYLLLLLPLWWALAEVTIKDVKQEFTREREKKSV